MESFRIDGNSARDYTIRVEEVFDLTPELVKTLLDIDLQGQPRIVGASWHQMRRDLRFLRRGVGGKTYTQGDAIPIHGRGEAGVTEIASHDPVRPLVPAQARYPERVPLSIAHAGPLDGHGSRTTEPSTNHPKEHVSMQHVRIATYEIKDGNFKELADIARQGMLRTFQEQPGFIRYGLADIGDRKCVSLSMWETRKDADAAVPVAERWVREHVASLVDLRTTQIGDLAFFEGTPAKV